MLRALLIWTIGLFLIGQLFAAPRESTEPVLKPRDLMLLKSIHERFPGMASPPLKEHQVVMTVRIGGGYWEALLLAANGAQVRTASEALQNALPEATTSRYSETGRVYLSQAHMGQSEATMTAPIGKLAAALRKSGFEPSVVLVVGKYAQIHNLDANLPSYTGKNDVYYYLREISDTQTVTVHVALSLGTRFWSLALPLLSLLFGLVGLFLAYRLPREKIRLLPTLMITCVCLYMPFSFVLITAGALSPLSDLWLGERMSGSNTSWLLAAPYIGFLLPIIGLSSREPRHTAPDQNL